MAGIYVVGAEKVVGEVRASGGESLSVQADPAIDTGD